MKPLMYNRSLCVIANRSVLDGINLEHPGGFLDNGLSLVNPTLVLSITKRSLLVNSPTSLFHRKLYLYF